MSSIKKEKNKGGKNPKTVPADKSIEKQNVLSVYKSGRKSRTTHGPLMNPFGPKLEF